jgi:hypothetical protein
MVALKRYFNFLELPWWGVTLKIVFVPTGHFQSARRVSFFQPVRLTSTYINEMVKIGSKSIL